MWRLSLLAASTEHVGAAPAGPAQRPGAACRLRCWPPAAGMLRSSPAGRPAQPGAHGRAAAPAARPTSRRPARRLGSGPGLWQPVWTRHHCLLPTTTHHVSSPSPSACFSELKSSCMTRAPTSTQAPTCDEEAARRGSGCQRGRGGRGVAAGTVGGGRASDRWAREEGGGEGQAARIQGSGQQRQRGLQQRQRVAPAGGRSK